MRDRNGSSTMYACTAAVLLVAVASLDESSTCLPGTIGDAAACEQPTQPQEDLHDDMAMLQTSLQTLKNGKGKEPEMLRQRAGAMLSLMQGASSIDMTAYFGILAIFCIPLLSMAAYFILEGGDLTKMESSALSAPSEAVVDQATEKAASPPAMCASGDPLVRADVDTDDTDGLADTEPSELHESRRDSSPNAWHSRELADWQVFAGSYLAYASCYLARNNAAIAKIPLMTILGTGHVMLWGSGSSAFSIATTAAFGVLDATFLMCYTVGSFVMPAALDLDSMDHWQVVWCALAVTGVSQLALFGAWSLLTTGFNASRFLLALGCCVLNGTAQ
eukprot:CAMPEP_0195060626 /NCGR_PEP_ID=MMETSP0448-20130528/7840_1 /TAXON_ID=66468 /ORGANISM="Heterocapsa triquestra, Strain CCMP 448" /LENGTH=332 /DNA_ID=CAMNT_0040091073 /DNA_START=89 /DNA_END=1084 /DNA_ORIENTATION=+